MRLLEPQCAISIRNAKEEAVHGFHNPPDPIDSAGGDPRRPPSASSVLCHRGIIDGAIRKGSLNFKPPSRVTTMFDEPSSIWIAAASAAAALVLVQAARAKRRNQLPLPPGPKGLPLIGNLLDIPQNKPWIVYNEWAERYGEPVSPLQSASC
jgi:hypothetical protein